VVRLFAGRRRGEAAPFDSHALVKEVEMLQRLQTALTAVLLAGALLCAGALAAQAKTELHWYGHSAWKIVTPSGGVILIDPWLTNPKDPDKEAVAHLDRVDYILLSHGHFDHVGNIVEIQKKTGAPVVASMDLVRNLIAVLGLPKDKGIGAYTGGSIDLPKAGAKVTLVNAVHGSDLMLPKPPESGPVTVPGGNPLGFVIQINGGPTIYHTGDTDVTEDMKLIPVFNHIDLMLACIGGWFTMDPVRAALAVDYVKPNHVIPMHYGTFPILTGTPAEFKAALAKYHLDGKLIAMNPGDTRDF
jgi:L-ascorbate metabolism protein UlaG (beta-lactamase superfamily)